MPNGDGNAFEHIKRSTKAYLLAEEHVSWFLQTVKPLLVTHFVHGYKHGFDEGRKKERKDE